VEVYKEVVCIGVLNSSQRLPLYQSTFAAPNNEPQQRRSLPYKEPKHQPNTKKRKYLPRVFFFDVEKWAIFSSILTRLLGLTLEKQKIPHILVK
jgi:hypothetical protein